MDVEQTNADSVQCGFGEESIMMLGNKREG